MSPTAIATALFGYSNGKTNAQVDAWLQSD